MLHRALIIIIIVIIIIVIIVIIIIIIIVVIIVIIIIIIIVIIIIIIIVIIVIIIIIIITTHIHLFVAIVQKKLSYFTIRIRTPQGQNVHNWVWNCETLQEDSQLHQLSQTKVQC